MILIFFFFRSSELVILDNETQLSYYDNITRQVLAFYSNF